jgi:hypothetical protein
LEKKHLLLIPVHVLNMEFPGRWDIFPIEEYATAIARSPGKAGMEVMAQARACIKQRLFLALHFIHVYFSAL